MHMPRIDACRVLRKEFLDNKLVALLLRLAKDSLKELLHPCPYTESFINQKVLKYCLILNFNVYRWLM